MIDSSAVVDVLAKLRNLCYLNAVNKGFWGKTDDAAWNFGEKVALIHSELSEMFEAWRKGIKESEKDITIFDTNYKPLPGQVQDGSRRITAIEEEVADVFIRLMDLCGKLDIDVGRVVLAKMSYNQTRPYMHNRKC